MEKVLVDKWYENKDRLENQFQLLLPEKKWYASTSDYADFAKLVLYTILQPKEKMEGCLFDISKGYSGDLAIVFLYNHCLYASIISYGSCCGCDSLEHACSCCWGYRDAGKQQAITELMTLALHIIQQAKLIHEDIYSYC